MSTRRFRTDGREEVACGTSYEEVVETGEKRYLRVATSVPVVSENCVMCHANFLGNKGNIGALAYTVPVVE